MFQLKSLFSRILLFSLLLSMTLSAIPTEQPNNLCPARGKFGVEISTYSTSDTPPAEPISFDEVGRYYNPTNGDTVTILLKKGDATNKYKFLHFDADFKFKGERECPGSEGMQFIALVDKFLVMKTPNAREYFMWRFDPIDPILKMQIELPDDFPSTVNNFIPYLTNGDNLYVMITHSNDNGQTKVLQIIWAAVVTSIAGILFSGNCIVGQLPEAIGNDVFLYNSLDNNFKIADGISWTDQLTLPSPVGKIIGSYRLRDRIIVLSMLEQDHKSGKLYKVKGVTPTQIVSTSSSIAYVDYSDDMSNFMRIGSSKILWVNMKDMDNIYSTQIESSDLDYANILDVSLSGNKAVLLYQNSMKYLRNVGGVVTSILVKTFADTDMDLDTSGQWKVLLSCICAQVKKAACFSSTLNCLLIKKAEHECFKVDDLTP